MTTMTTLIVDDQEQNRVVLREYATMLGLIVAEAADGPEALAFIRETPPDLVLLDINMPGMSGIDVLETMKTDPALQAIPVIIITAVDDTKNTIQSIERGAEDYLIKPFNPVLLRARIRACLDRKRLHDLDRKRKKELEEALSLKTTLMRVASHDLRNPLSVVTGYADLLLKKAPAGSIMDNRKYGYVGSIRDAARRMNDILETFLSYQRVRATHLQLTPEALPADNLLHDMHATHVDQARLKGISLQVNVPDDSISILADRKCVREAISNYLGNALKYAPKGSTVILAAYLEKDKVRIEVRDQGSGVLEHERDQLFREFAQFGNIPTGGEKSTGLGLYIVSRLVEAMEGCVGAEFPTEGGSVFWLTLPLAETENALSAHTSDSAGIAS